MVKHMTHARLHRYDQIALKDLRALDRDRTVVLLPVGMLEEHGDHLPFGVDNFAAEAVTLAAASWLLDNDHRLHVLLMPLLPYGADPIDTRRPDLFAAAGSVAISHAALKLLVMEIVEQLVRFGFRHVFPVNFHGGPGQSIVLEEVCAEMRARHPGLVMYEPSGYVMAGAALDVIPGLATLLGRPLTTAEEVALKGSIHAGMFETSLMLSLRPDLVDPSYRHLRTIEWNQLYHMPDWPGYVGAGPSHASAEVGAAVLRWRGVRAAALIHRAMDGEDLSGLRRHPVWLDEGEPDSITEAPGDDELPPRDPVHDSRPEMFISREQIEQARAAADQADNPSHEDRTPPSSLFETRPGGLSGPELSDSPPAAE